MKKALVIGLALLTAGCSMPSQVSPEVANEIVSKLSYVRDDRTGLCFAAIESIGYAGYKSVSITTIPCEKMPK